MSRVPLFYSSVSYFQFCTFLLLFLFLLPIPHCLCFQQSILFSDICSILLPFYPPIFRLLLPPFFRPFHPSPCIPFPPFIYLSSVPPIHLLSSVSSIYLPVLAVPSIYPPVFCPFHPSPCFTFPSIHRTVFRLLHQHHVFRLFRTLDPPFFRSFNPSPCIPSTPSIP